MDDWRAEWRPPPGDVHEFVAAGLVMDFGGVFRTSECWWGGLRPAKQSDWNRLRFRAVENT
jgi:hypothetical protein